MRLWSMALQGTISDIGEKFDGSYCYYLWKQTTRADELTEKGTFAVGP